MATRRDSPSAVNIRKFTRNDAEGVRRICYHHFRSLCKSAVIFWIFQHIFDLCAIMLIIKLFMSFTEVGISALLFLGYLLARAKWEMEYYIWNDCPDLDDVYATYMNDLRCHFWVAEIGEPVAPISGRRRQSNTSNSKSISSSADKLTRNPPTEPINHENNSVTNAKNNPPSFSTEEENFSGHPLVNSTLCGCIGLAPYKDDTTIAQLVRLVVSHESRRMRVGSRLLSQLEIYAREQGYREVRLYNNNLNTSPLKFVRQNGYQLNQVVRRGLLRGDLLVWTKKLEDVSKEPQLESRASGVLD